ncbi:MAG: bifunctional riboflavin kinase/FAD synthetase [Pelosinus sp.]|nr:bifunctional riboflavin kinase/FAD synthetase [Pelosinus sp.]
MKIFTQITNLAQQFPNIAVALGTFDGVHIGHQEVIGKAVAFAKKSAGTSVVFTFSNHPLSAIAPEYCPLQLMSLESRANVLEKIGVDVLLTIPFTKEFLQLSPDEFITLLLNELAPKLVVVGPNYSFGNKSAGTPEMLKQAGLRHGFEVEVEPVVTLNGVVVSSTYIRQLITEGKVNEAEKFLGRLVSLSGTVVPGEQRGRKIGFPTANIELQTNLAVPQDGVYAVRVRIGAAVHYGVANIGVNPTFSGRKRRMEVHIMNFSGNLYQETLEVEFLAYLRLEQSFDSVESLKNQIARDVKAAQQYFTI